MSDWVPPHQSTKYAVVQTPEGYLVVAVHAVDVNAEAIYASEQTALGTIPKSVTEILGSPQAPIGPVHGYRAPRRFDADRILLMCQTSEMAWRHKHLLEEEDHRVASDSA
jgi:hypothetical protein